MIGKTLAQYEILERIGQGGMGEVYRARDTRLGRSVAIKFLPALLADNPRAMQRLQREARMLASVQHPNVAAVHGLESVDGQSFIAMEYVEGEDLSTRLTRGAIPHAEAIGIALEIARGLEEAHRHGIVHRDLKPGNVRMSKTGSVKILDFGLAREARDDVTGTGSDAMTVVASLTEQGEILGTPAYMSPEQARGERVDGRADLWALGLILHEMLTGQRAFVGRTAVDTLSLVLQRDPDFDSLRLVAPAETGRIVRQCLRKDRNKRMQSAGDLRVRLEDVAAGDHGTIDTPASGSSWGRALILVVLIGLPIAVWFLKPGADRRVADGGRYQIAAPDGLRFYHRYQHGLAISPDGRTLAFAAGETDDPTTPGSATSHIYLRDLDSWEATRLAGTENGSQPVFSPDGSWIAFIQDHRLRKISIAGGTVETLHDSHACFGVSFLPDGSLVLGSFAGGLGRLERAGGAVDTLALPDRATGETQLLLPHVLPNGNAVVFTGRDMGTSFDYEEQARVKVLSLDSGEQRVLIPGGSDARYVESGHLVYAKEGSLFAIAFDVDRLETVGGEVRVLDGVVHSAHAGSPYRETSAAQFAISRTGTLAYLPGSIFPERLREVVWISRDGTRDRLDVDEKQYSAARISPDGQRALLSTNYPPYDVWTYDLARGALRRQTYEGVHYLAVWGPGERQFTVGAVLGRTFGTLVHEVDRGEQAGEVIPVDGRFWPQEWVGDTPVLLAESWAGSNLHTITVAGEATPIFESRHQTGSASLSPDRGWLLYTSTESGETNVYVREWPDGDTGYQVSVDEGFAPIWSPGGNEICFWSWNDDVEQTSMYAVDFAAENGQPALSAPTRLFDAPWLVFSRMRNYDVAADGRFLVVLAHTDSLDAEIGRKVFPDRMRIVTDWVSELEQRMGEERP